jgi:dienelactone hydrolase
MNDARLARFAGLLLLSCTALVHAATDPLAVAPPRPLAGPYPIACSNVAQDFSRLPAGEPAELSWEGFPRSDGSQRYVTDLLSEPNDTLVVRYTPPDDATLFGPWRGQTLTDVVIVCYPTSAANTRPDFPLPNGKSIPHMQRGAEGPILPDASRWPVLAFSHGYGGSPLSDGHIEAVAVFASHGYIVVAPFHGDPRYALLSFDDIGGALSAIAQFDRYTAMQAVRPLSVSAAIDLLLSHPHWRDRVDASRIGGFGASQGGETMMLLGGAELTTSIFLSTKRVTKDDRIKAAVGYVPYFGQRILPAFGRDNRGVDGVALPFLAISGTADTTAPIGLVEDAMHRLASSRELVALTGIAHGLDPVAASDIFTWSLEWVDAMVKDDRAARARVMRMEQVAGGVQDIVRNDYVVPAPELADERKVVEFYNASLDHYFITAEPAEIAMLDQGVVVPGWHRTGFEFKSWTPGSSSGVAACRFFGTPGRGPNSHFFTIDANECTIVKANLDWTFEGLAFQALPINLAICPADRTVIWRLYNNGMGGQANHRYLTSHSEIGDMTGRGWLLEGPVFCTPP